MFLCGAGDTLRTHHRIRNPVMRYILYLNDLYHSDSRDLTVIMATVRSAVQRDWCVGVRIEKRVTAVLAVAI